MTDELAKKDPRDRAADARMTRSGRRKVRRRKAQVIR
jgi:hypothetical protein